MAGTVKAFGFSLEYVLYDLSYSNLVLLGATLPTFGDDEDREEILPATYERAVAMFKGR